MEEQGTSKDTNNEQNINDKRKFKRNQNQKGSERFKPYSGSQKEGQGFADLRKKKAAREYLKFLQSEKKSDEGSFKETGRKPPLQLFDILGRPTNKSPKVHSFSRAQKAADERRNRKEEEREKFLKEKEAKDSAIKSYKAKKKERFLKLCKKTRKGQPVMKNQMEVLLEKIMKHKGMDTDKDKNNE